MRRRLAEQGFGADRAEIQSFALNILAGLASIVIVTVGGPTPPSGRAWPTC